MRLLLVEDSHRLRTTLAKALTRLGHAVDQAQDAEEGETLVEIHGYDAIGARNRISRAIILLTARAHAARFSVVLN